MAAHIRYATPADAADCNAFHNHYYRTSRSVGQWKWAFCSSLRNGPMVPFVLAEDGGRVVGTQAMIPIPMIDGGGVFWTAKSEETLVDPAYRRCGLFFRMYQRLLCDAKEQGIVSVWGFTWASRVLESLLGFEGPATTRQLFRPLSTKGVRLLLDRYLGSNGQRRPKAVRLLGHRLCGAVATSASSMVSAVSSMTARSVGVPGLHLTTLTAPPERAEELCAAFVRQWGGATIFRDANYLRWRFFENAFVRATVRAAYFDDQLVGWIAYALDEDSIGYLVDTIVATGDSDRRAAQEVARVLVGDAVRRLQKAGALGIRAWHVNDHPFDRMLRRELKRGGFYLISKGEPMVVYPRLGKTAQPSLRRFDNWFVSRAYTQGPLG